MARGRGGGGGSSSSSSGSGSGSSSIDQQGAYYIAETVLSGLWITPLCILWFISLCLARRKKDPARVGVAWIKAAYPLWILALLLSATSGAMLIWYWFADSTDYSASVIGGIVKAINHTRVTGTFLGQLTDIFLFITFVELSSGFLLCLNGGLSVPTRKRARYAVLAWGFVLFVLAVTLFGLLHASLARPINSRSDVLRRSQDLLTTDRLGGAVLILMWITSIAMVTLASYVVHKTKHNGQLRSPAILLLVATILDFLRLLANMAIYSAAVLRRDDMLASNGGPVVPLAVNYIVQPLIDNTFMFILLVLLFTLAVRKRKGLWSQAEPSWNFPAGAYTPAHGGPVAVPVPMHGGAPLPPQAQQQQPLPQMQQGLPAYLQAAQQQQWQQQQQQGYYSYPQQQQQPMADPKSGADVHAQGVPPVANGFHTQGHGQGNV